MTNALTITRPFNGIGDWLFCLAVLKFVNRQRPDIECFVDFDHVQVGKLPYIIPDLYQFADVHYAGGVGPKDGLITHDSLVYRRWPPDSFIESTVMHLNDQTGLDIKYEPDVLPSFGIRHYGAKKKTIAMIAHGKRQQRSGKEWGVENFQELARVMRRQYGYEVVQIGASYDIPLIHAERACKGAAAEVLLETLAECAGFVGIENGMTVLAGYMGVPQMTVYDGAGFPSRMQFPKQQKFIERAEPDAVAARVVAMLEETGPC